MEVTVILTYAETVTMGRYLGLVYAAIYPGVEMSGPFYNFNSGNYEISTYKDGVDSVVEVPRALIRAALDDDEGAEQLCAFLGAPMANAV